VFSLDVPPKPSNYVNDYVQFLSPQTVSTLNAQLKGFEEKTSVQIVVAIFSSLDGESLEDFSIRLADQWQIGQAGKDNGVILSFYIKDRKMRLEVGYGLEDKITDLQAQQIINNVISPLLKQGKRDQGVTLGVKAIAGLLDGTLDPSILNRKKVKKKKNTLAQLVSSIFFFLFWIFFIRSFFGRGYRSGRRGSSGVWFGGGGSSSSGGGFSGGGGSFGGGGASGGW